MAYLSGLEKLKVIDLNYTKVSGGTLVHLRNMKRLERLWVIGTKFVDSDIAEFHKYHPGAEIYIK